MSEMVTMSPVLSSNMIESTCQIGLDSYDAFITSERSRHAKDW